ncbi:hypothetical protein P171DRAFT_469196 [Karstenula rhodostoma CBS 690.94]|uniref:Zn(2)-C6 fungal-type domain-containing protein n=1 Tax=Karstenula rhodostoma CBS 690.94 TaxID=1392251 RepID=A0A9P4UGG8_9PLEO|nr:hypothetical protein P171DRAFT_469196 [Karstenula rhodostoma CBS 690.94]
MSTVEVSGPISQTTGPLYFCSLCNKPFSQETSCTRHIKYCRRRAAQQRQIRPKACHPCRSAKIRCDFKYPCCRCTSKQLVCSYGQNQVHISITEQAGSKVKPNSDSATDQTGAVSLLTWPSSERDNTPSNRSHEDIVPISLDDLTSIDVFGHLNATFSSPGTLPKSPASRRDFSLPHIFVDVTGENADPLDPGLSLPPESSPRSLAAPTSLSLALSPTTLHPPRPPGLLSNGTRHFLLSIISSYPRMLAQGPTLPPFIHPHGSRLHFDAHPSETTTSPDANPHPSPLQACTTIARLLLSHPNPSSAAFIWRTISTEHAHILSNLPTFPLASTLAALQATMLYGTMRVALSGRPYASINPTLVHTMERLAARSCTLTGTPFSVRHSRGEKPTWEDWISEETRRRISVVCFLLALTIPSAPDDLIANPNNHVLPASKALWEARTREEWEALYCAQQHGAARLETVGDFIVAKLGRVGMDTGADAVDEMIGRWYAEMDGLGMMLAAVVSSL